MNCIMYTSWQKYYNALKSIDSLEISEDIIKNISNIDNFFAEFRTITLVMQKSFSNNKCLDIYNKYQESILKSDNMMKWFIDKRNEITKEFSIKLEKEINIFKYINFYKTKVHEITLDVESDETLCSVLEQALKKMASKKQYELHISVEIVFKENGEQIDMFKHILHGIEVMENFMHCVSEEIQCNCNLCSKLKKEIRALLNKIQLKTVFFHFDYYIPPYNVNEIIAAPSVEMYMVTNDGKNLSPKDMRIELENSLYKDNRSNSIDIFKYFSAMHFFFYRQQKNSLMPTFFILFSDNSFTQYSFIPNAKSQAYREINYVANLIMSQNVLCVFSINEFYVYNDSSRVHMSYQERTKLADGEMLKSTMISSELYEINYVFDPKQPNCLNMEQLDNLKKNKFTFPSMFLPIYRSFVKKSKLPFSQKGLDEILIGLSPFRG